MRGSIRPSRCRRTSPPGIAGAPWRPGPPTDQSPLRIGPPPERHSS
jgi:hypothetical protein